MRNQKRLQFGIAVATLALLVTDACQFIKIQDTNQQSQGQTGPSNPTASPSPSADCALGSILPGTADDARTIKQGGTVAIGVELVGSQGLPLVDSCKSQYSPAWLSVAGSCTFVGSFDGIASAPATAAVGSTCTAEVAVGSKRERLSLVVTAASSALAPRTLEATPEPSPTPEEPGMGVVDR